jgi:hypothetical protein
LRFRVSAYSSFLGDISDLINFLFLLVSATGIPQFPNLMGSRNVYFLPAESHPFHSSFLQQGYLWFPNLMILKFSTIHPAGLHIHLFYFYNRRYRLHIFQLIMKILSSNLCRNSHTHFLCIQFFGLTTLHRESNHSLYIFK